MSSSLERFLQTAEDLYDEVVFNTDALFNEPAPDPWVAFMIGGILSGIGLIYWWFRLKRIGREMAATYEVPFVGSLKVRGMISAAIDSDETLYTIIKMGAQSFLFLGGLQLDYQITFTVMLGFFAFESCGDTLRILLGFLEANTIQDVMVTSSGMKTKVRNKAELQPTNVYEDLSRDKVIVLMVFITQCILISFVIADIYESETTSCKDGSSDCPVVGTFGSWSFYVLGIFMACVFLLGPKTAFGQSEQNPAYWLKLLVFAKQTKTLPGDTSCTWFDPHQDKVVTRALYPGDYRIWMRFCMSFLINGVGFHVLVHALPIQVASQSSFTGVVFRAVGMMYLVDLDDTPGYKLTIVQEETPEEAKEEDEEQHVSNDKHDDNFGDVMLSKDDMVPEKDPQIKMSQMFHHEDHHQDMDVKAEADKILAEAREKLDHLAAMTHVDSVPTNKQHTSGALIMAGAIPLDTDEGAPQARGLPNLGSGGGSNGGKGASGDAGD